MTDYAPPGRTHDRRICTGDWVRLAGNAPSLRGVGKVVDGDFHPDDHAMRAACVDMGTRTYWVPPADLVRVLPDDEVRLCELALERGLVDAERDPSRLDRLERALTGVRQGTTQYVRTPGLLDVLWGGSIHADPDHGSRAIAGFLDEALDVLAAARRDPRRRPVQPIRRVSDDEDDGVTIRELLAAEARSRAEAKARDDEATERRARDEAAAAPKTEVARLVERAQAYVARVASPRPQGPPTPKPRPTLATGSEVLPRILHVLNNAPLSEVLCRQGIPVPPNRRKHSGKLLASKVLEAGIPLQAVLEVLTLNQLRLACGAVGMQGEIENDPVTLRARLLALSP